MQQKTLSEVQEAAERVVLRDPDRTNVFCRYFTGMKVPDAPQPSCVVAEVFHELGLVDALLDEVRRHNEDDERIDRNEVVVSMLWPDPDTEPPLTNEATLWLQQLQSRCDGDGDVGRRTQPTWKDAYVDQINGVPVPDRTVAYVDQIG